MQAKVQQPLKLRRHQRLAVGGLLVAGTLATVAGVSVVSQSGPNIEPLSPAARGAVDATTAELRSGCYSEAEAEALLRANLVDAGETGEVSVQPDGPLAYPIGEADAVRTHLGNGCTTYSGTGLDQDGQRVFYISGIDALEAWDAAIGGPE